MSDWYNITYKVRNTEIECSVPGSISETTDELDYRARATGRASEVVAQMGMSVVPDSKREVTTSDHVLTGYAK